MLTTLPWLVLPALPPLCAAQVIRATRRQGAKTALALKQQLLGAEQLPGDAEVGRGVRMCGMIVRRIR